MGIYSILDPSKRQIRLLRVLSDGDTPDSEQGSSLVRCELSVHSLNHDNPPSYTALSYVWGPPSTMSGSADDTLVVNGEAIPARENLLLALRAFRRREDTTYLWVDAVCINQDDLEEKMTQIKLMGDIYSLAERTVIWLGPAEDDSDVAMDVLRDLEVKDFESPRFEEKLGDWKAIRLLLQRSWCKHSFSRRDLPLTYEGIPEIFSSHSSTHCSPYEVVNYEITPLQKFRLRATLYRD